MKLIETTEELSDFCLYVSRFDFVTIDTEFLREKTYYSKLCLVQIAVDSNDKIHISYWNQTQSSLMYSTNSGGSWAHSMIDNAGYVGEWTSIAIDSNDKVHISYYEKFGTSSTGHQ